MLFSHLDEMDAQNWKNVDALDYHVCLGIESAKLGYLYRRDGRNPCVLKLATEPKVDGYKADSQKLGFPYIRNSIFFFSKSIRRKLFEKIDMVRLVVV